jgi:hypothetical protein
VNKKLILVALLCVAHVSLHAMQHSEYQLGLEQVDSQNDYSVTGDTSSCYNESTRMKCGPCWSLYPYKDSVVRLNIYRMVCLCTFIAGVGIFAGNGCEGLDCLAKTVVTLFPGVALFVDVVPFSLGA